MLTPSQIETIKRIREESYIYPIWANSEFFTAIVDSLAEPFMGKGITKVIGLESRGFILGAPVAFKLGAGFCVARKEGKMFNEPELFAGLFKRTYVDYTGKPKGIEIENNPDVLNSQDKVLIVDDWIETCNSTRAVIDILENDVKCEVVGISVLFDQSHGKSAELFEKYLFNGLISI